MRQDVHEKTIEFGLKALACVKRYRTSAEPLMYEVWYEHVAGRHAPLSEEIVRRVTERPIQDDDIRDLHARHLSTARQAEWLSEIGAGTQAEVKALLAAITAALGDLSGVDSDLCDINEKLAEPGLSPEAARKALGFALQATRKLSDTNQALRQGMLASQAGIEALRVELETSRFLALTDDLTGLSNRRAFDSQMHQRLHQALEENVPLSVILIDIDHFKSFNDTHGHHVGDQVLRLVGNCIKQGVRPNDMAARYGGEEFAVVAFGLTRQQTVEMAEAIRLRIGSYEIVQQGTKRSLGRVTISLGVATLTRGDTEESLLKRADERLYEAKRSGRNRVESDQLAAA